MYLVNFNVFIDSLTIYFRCVMALIRGGTGNFPCPICLVPHEELGDLTKSYPLRSTGEMKDIHNEAQFLNMTNRDAYLKEFGLRDIEVLSSSDSESVLYFVLLICNLIERFLDDGWVGCIQRALLGSPPCVSWGTFL